MRHESIPGRRGALWGASAAVLCLGGVLAACGSGGAGGGYVAVGPGGGSPGASGAAVAPSEDVSLVPLDGSGRRGPGSGGAKSGDGRAGSDGGGSTSSGGGPGSAAGEGTAGRGDATKAGGAKATSGGSGSGSTGTGGTGTGSSSGSDSGRTGGSPGGSPGGGTGHSSAPATPEPSASLRPAALGVTGTARAATDHRWCEKVTVSLRNTGGTAVRSGTVTFGTHIIGSLGIDWATITSTETLPAPIAAGARKDGTWTVCVDAWRVPLGMHIETRDVSVQWK
ncbi:hypothetical protein [Streptomyces sp. NPDC048643]|uniref:hypothetical protein n=1 Tax=Streptomyces sp. NPDC048643 TaxID=3155637 RepID=UPI0034231EAF